uniref:mannosyl-oligosaccharide 1,3-1,6-alpha-mannosidase n=1 Tax=Ascaris lumbricoides TaxID=6252 RepID=A0A0M3IT24_ASCLU
MKLSNLYESNKLLIMWGDDFRYNMLEEWYQQYDNLSPIFDQINSWNRTHIRFGTFIDYFTALQQFNIDNAINAVTLTGDFFPYQCAIGDIWTGYYTTRPFYKKQGRQLHALIRAADLATTNMIQKLSDDERKWLNDKLTFARRNLSLFQHHDAITGTSKKHVMSNYAQLLFESMKAVATCLAKVVSIENMMDFEILIFHADLSPLSTSIFTIIADEKHHETFIAEVAYVNDRHEEVVIRPEDFAKSFNVKLVKPDEFFIETDAVRTTHSPENGLINLIFHADLSPLSTSIFTIIADEKHHETFIAEVAYVNDGHEEVVIRPEDFTK